jgi:hypothetical protein
MPAKLCRTFSGTPKPIAATLQPALLGAQSIRCLLKDMLQLIEVARENCLKIPN